MHTWERFLKVEGWKSGYGSVDNALRHYGRRVRSEKTRSNFCGTLMRFCQYANIEPDSLVKMSVEKASRLCQDFTDSLKDKGYSLSYVNTCQAYLKTFFRENGFKNGKELQLDHYYQPSRYRKKPEYIPTPEEVYKMAYAAGSSRNRAMVFVAHTSGLRNSTLRSIKYGDVEEEIEKGKTVVKINVYPEMKKLDPKACKGDIPYYTFISHEAINALKEYLEERAEVYGEILSEEPLFCSNSNKLSLERQRKTIMSNIGYERMVKGSARKAGIKRWKDVTPHCLRKTFESALRNSGLDVKDQEFLMGHILSGSQDAYYDRSKVEEMGRKYSQVNFFPQRGGMTEEMRKKQLLDTAKLLGFADERLRQFQEILAKAKNVDEGIEKFKRLKDNPEPKENNNVKVVRGEKALVDHLKQGWTLIKELNHNKYLISS